MLANAAERYAHLRPWTIRVLVSGMAEMAAIGDVNYYLGDLIRSIRYPPGSMGIGCPCMIA